MAARLLVLGAGGFLGRSISEHLAGTGAVELILHSRGANDRAGFPDGIESCTLDLLECRTGAIAELVERLAPDAVINCTGTAVGNPDDMRGANLYVVMRLIAELEECKGVHIVHLGSAAEYGTQNDKRPVSEDMPARPQSDYGISKLKATEQLMRAAENGRITTTVLRVFNPIGRYSPATTLPGSAARKIDAALRAGSDAINLGALDAWRDYVDTRDVARAILAAAVTTPRVSQVLNVGRGEAIETLQLVNTLASIAGYDGQIIESADRSARSACVDWQCADVRSIKVNLGWAAEHSTEESLRELWSGISSGTE